MTDSRRRRTEDQTRADNIKIIVCQELFRQYLIEPNRSNATLVRGRWNQNCAIATQRKIDEGVWLAWSLKLLIYSLFYRGKYFTTLLLLFLHTKTKGRGRRENNNKLLPKFPPKLCQLLYIFIVNWMPPPSSSIDEICVFCHRTIWQKKQKAITAVLWNAIFTANSVFAELSLDLPRNNARILRSGVNRRNIDLWPKTELVVDVNYQLAVNHREGDKEPQTQQDCRKPGLIETTSGRM